MRGVSRITLGTAQLGLPYGIANRSGKPSRTGAHRILDAAYELGITSFDTAVAYGDGESILGEWIRNRGTEPVIITKLSGPPDNVPDAESFFARQLEDSLGRLGVPVLAGVLVHSFDVLQQHKDALLSVFADFKERGKIERAGCSVYSPEEAVNAADIEGIEIVQAPFNLFDNRLKQSGALKTLSARGITIFVRSVFLQGLLFLDPEEGDHRVPGAASLLRKVNDYCRQLRLTRQELAYAYAAALPGVRSIVIGAETKEQVDNIQRYFDLMPLDATARDVIENSFAEVPEAIIDPRLWPKES